MSKKLSLEELEAVLNREEETPIQILPNGEIREVGQWSSAEVGTKKPLTLREDLGGEYGEMRDEY